MTRIVVRTALLALALCAVCAPVTSARTPQHTGAVVPDGRYGQVVAPGEYLLFTVRHRRVYDLAYNALIECQASDAPSDADTQPRFFFANDAPDGHLISASGRLELSWWETSGDRRGHTAMQLHFGLRDRADVQIVVPQDAHAAGEASEACSGVRTLPFRRGYELTPPTPSG